MKRMAMIAEAQKSRRRRQWKWIFGGALILCLLLATGRYSRKRSLLEQSTRVVDSHDGWRQPYRWISDHQILVDHWQEEEPLYTYDIRTQQEVCLKALNQKLNRGHCTSDMDWLRVSPDGTRLLWSQFSSSPVHGIWMDGSHFFTEVPPRNSEIPPWTEVRWTEDSRHWVAFAKSPSGATEARIYYDGDPAHKPTIVPVAASDHSVPLETIDLDTTQSLVLGDHILACAAYDTERDKGSAEIVDIGIGAHVTGLKTRHITLPPHAYIEDIVLSPQGDRIAWLLSMRGGPDWLLQLQRRIPRVHLQAERVEGVWISRIDGAEMHEISRREVDTKHRFPPRLDQLQWVPGSKRLSFMYQDALYTVPAE